MVADVDELDGGGARGSGVGGASGKGVGGLGPGCEGGVGSRGEVAEIHGYGSNDGQGWWLGVQRKQVTGRKEKLIPCRLDSLGEYDRMHYRPRGHTYIQLHCQPILVLQDLILV